VKNEIINISGKVKNVSFENSTNTSVIGWYADESESDSGVKRNSVPFAFEKNYANGGKIILVNAGGYFDAISESPVQYLTTLSNISSILGIRFPEAPHNSFTTLPTEQYIGSFDISGNVTLKSKSLQLNNYTQNYMDSPDYKRLENYSITTEGIKIYKDNKLKSNLGNASIIDIKLIGDYDTIIKSKNLKLPYMTSEYNYFGMLLPKFNLTINLSDELLSSAQLVIQNQQNQTSTGITKINVEKGSTITFDNIQSKLLSIDSDPISISVPTTILLKNPDIELDGKAKYSMLEFWWNYLEKTKYDVQGLKTNLKFIDEYIRPDGNGTKAEYITFLNNTDNQ
jgi:hypothetical protein